jgi:hypothetical protein
MFPTHFFVADPLRPGAVGVFHIVAGQTFRGKGKTKTIVLKTKKGFAVKPRKPLWLAG